MSNKYTYSVPFTEDEIYKCYVVQGMTQIEIAKKFGVSQKVVWRAMNKMGIPRRKAFKRNQVGELNSSWKGGRVLQGASSGRTRFSDGGYWYVLKPDHPNATKSGYVAEHVFVATETVGRPASAGECVHHKDMNKQNNVAGNLVLCTRKKHREYHLQLELIAIELYRRGLVMFDDEQGYILRKGGGANVP